MSENYYRISGILNKNFRKLGSFWETYVKRKEIFHFLWKSQEQRTSCEQGCSKAWQGEFLFSSYHVSYVFYTYLKLKHLGNMGVPFSPLKIPGDYACQLCLHGMLVSVAGIQLSNYFWSGSSTFQKTANLFLLMSERKWELTISSVEEA